MRGLVYALRPKSLERDGLAVSLADHVEALKRAHGIEVDVRVEGVPRLPLDDEVALFRIAQEALQNSVKHGVGAPVSVLLRHSRAGTELDIKDRGPGFNPAALPATVRTMGLGTMQDRARAIHAEFTIKTAPHDGCEIHVFLPARRGMSAASRIRVVIVDDHAVVRQGLRAFLELQDDIEVSGEAGSGADAARVAAESDAEVVLMDLVMPGGDGISAIREARAGAASAGAGPEQLHRRRAGVQRHPGRGRGVPPSGHPA